MRFKYSFENQHFSHLAFNSLASFRGRRHAHKTEEHPQVGAPPLLNAGRLREGQRSLQKGLQSNKMAKAYLKEALDTPLAVPASRDSLLA